MDAHLKSYAQANVARYTSYPTARQFGPRVGNNEVSSWLTAVRADEDISLYLHLPFCQKLCWYCACATSVPNGYNRVSSYVDLLLNEISIWARLLDGRGQVARIHFGGGSPNMLSCADFKRIMKQLSACFSLKDNVEIAVELDPRSLSDDFIETMADVGVSRASLGVQTLAPAVQDTINRIQPRKQITRAMSHLRKSGIKQISFDLMYGLPRQTSDDVAEAIEYAATVGANRVSVFGYAHVPWFVSRQKVFDEKSLPNVEARFEQVQLADALLLQNGYEPVGFDHYALPGDSLICARNTGRLFRNFQGFTDDPCDTLIGIGESSISSFSQGYAQNHKDRSHWSRAVKERRLPIVRGVERTEDDLLRADIIEQLLCYLVVDVADICAERGMPIEALSECFKELEALEREGLCHVSGARVTIPSDKKFFARQVAARFDQYIIDERQHAIAV